tara:strand:- start:7 stop:219 length:213 start_codon:yes stop_codon:yes gene_type:complete
MNNLAFINKDPILIELDNAVDKSAAKKMIAFKYFSNDVKLLDQYLKETNYNSSEYDQAYVEPISQLELSF